MKQLSRTIYKILSYALAFTIGIHTASTKFDHPIDGNRWLITIFLFIICVVWSELKD